MEEVNQKFTALADEVRELSGTTDLKGLEEMTSDIASANEEVVDQAELIAQIAAALEGKATTGGGEDVTAEVNAYTAKIAELEATIAELEKALGIESDIERLEGDGQEFYTMAPSTLSFRSTAPLNELQDITINGETVDPSNYALEEGSTIVKLKHDYLSTLDTGKYELAVVSDSKTAKGEFTVAAPESNEYGFYYNQIYYGGHVDLGGNFFAELAFFITESNECFLINYEAGGCSTATMTQEGNLYTIYYSSDVYFTGYFASSNMFKGTKSFAAGSGWMPDYVGDGVDFLLSEGDYRAASDGSIVYVKRPKLEEYSASRCLSTLEKIDNIKTNILDAPVTTISGGCFQNCDHLKELVIPDSVLSVHASILLGADNIEKLTIPSAPLEQVMGIGGKDVLSYLGNSSKSIHTLVLYDGATSIFNKAFAGTDLINITLPSTLIRIEFLAFSNSTSMTNIVFRGTCEQWQAVEKGPDWNLNVPATHVQCSDGQVAL